MSVPISNTAVAPEAAIAAEPSSFQRAFEVAVRTLCDFTAKAGDLDRRFSPSPSAQEGIAGHRTVAARRGPQYERELAMAADCRGLHVRGRADGYDPLANRLEEFKTYRGDLRRMPANQRALHWAQLRIYGALLCQQRGLCEINLALVYFDVATEEETILAELQSARALWQHLAQHCERFRGWAEAEAAHRLRRDQALAALRFPFETFHGGQRVLAEAVYRQVRDGRNLLAQAPTAIGKTMGTLFPALRAMPQARLDKVFYLVAKTSGRDLALSALRRLRAGGADRALRVVELVARKKACEYPQNTCDAAGCPLARGFYDRLPAARAEAMQIAFLDHVQIRELALKHSLCPYYLAQELARWSDVVVGDYNYYFDLHAMLYGWTLAEGWRVCIEVDEAHNLLERARRMYTASLQRAAFDAARRAAPMILKQAFTGIARAWLRLLRAQAEDYRAYADMPRPLLAALEEFIVSASAYLSENPQPQASELLTFYFDAVRFYRLCSEIAADMLFDVSRGAGAERGARFGAGSCLCVRNVVPRRLLAPRFQAAHAAVLFSATLAPHDFYLDVLGLAKDTATLDVGAPFEPQQLTVTLVSSISTRYRHRARSLEPIAELIAAQLRKQPGNYLAFFSSFEYMHAAAAHLARRHPAIECWQQAQQMSEPERERFLARFVAGGCGVGFAVLGGAFAEGIDLRGERLIGAFIATLGLPPVNCINAELERRMAALFGCGHDYTYLFPGLQKVVQAAGRVIRAPSDRGVLYLIDDRINQRKVRNLLPAWWRISAVA